MKKWGIPATLETYQACAASCAKEKDGVWLLEIMKVCCLKTELDKNSFNTILL